MADQTMDADAGVRTVVGWATNISAGPADEAGQSLVFTATPDDADLFAVAPAINADTGTLTYTPDATAAGMATVTVTLQDHGGESDTSPEQTFTVSITVSSAATFTADVVGGTAPLTVVFTDTSPGNILTWSWDFGDDGFSEVKHPTHIYTAEGVYTVKLTITWADGTDTKTETDCITVKSDTDGDGVPDDVERSGCMDAADADTDEDGIPDGVEDANQNGVVDGGETDPNAKDRARNVGALPAILQLLLGD